MPRLPLVRGAFGGATDDRGVAAGRPHGASPSGARPGNPSGLDDRSGPSLGGHWLTLQEDQTRGQVNAPEDSQYPWTKQRGQVIASAHITNHESVGDLQRVEPDKTLV